MPANGINGPGIHELIEGDCCYCYRILREKREKKNTDEQVEEKKIVRELFTIIANPFARIRKGRISKVYATNMGVYARS